MTKEQLLEKAIYIQYPLTYNVYKEYNIKNIHKLPLHKVGEMYDKWKYNSNHFTTEYHRNYSLPLLNKLLNFGYNKDDFTLKNKTSNGFDISMLCPKAQYEYEIYELNNGQFFDNINYNDLLTKSKANFINATDYHKLYIYPHKCSKITNKTINNGRLLYISGDSQMIPDLPILSCYFKEIWYMDNRDNLTFNNKYKDIVFTDVLIELNYMEQKQYVDINFK